jgi:hypothetical protein
VNYGYLIYCSSVECFVLPQKRRAVFEDVSIGFGIPVLQMILRELPLCDFGSDELLIPHLHRVSREWYAVSCTR